MHKKILVGAVAALALAGCTERREAETRSEAGRMERNAEQAGASMERKAEQAGSTVEQKTETAGGEMREAARDVGQATERAGEAVAGKVREVTNDLLTLDTGDEVRIGEDTKFFRGGQEISRDEIRPGDEVRAAFEGGDGPAARVEVGE